MLTHLKEAMAAHNIHVVTTIEKLQCLDDAPFEALG